MPGNGRPLTRCPSRSCTLAPRFPSSRASEQAPDERASSPPGSRHCSVLGTGLRRYDGRRGRCWSRMAGVPCRPCRVRRLWPKPAPSFWPPSPSFRPLPPSFRPLPPSFRRRPVPRKPMPGNRAPLTKCPSRACPFALRLPPSRASGQAQGERTSSPPGSRHCSVLGTGLRRYDGRRGRQQPELQRGRP